MKVKDAVDLIKSESKDDNDLYKGLCNAVENEINALIELRSHGKKPTDNLIAGVIDEVCDWGWKVGRGVSMTDDRIKLAIDSERGVAFAKYRTIDPVAANQLKKMRRAYLGGVPPIMVLSSEGLDAITGMMLGHLMQECREYVEEGKKGSSIGRVQIAKMAIEMKLSDKPFCPYGVRARFCENQETLFPATKEVPLPTDVEQLQFYCKIDPKDCDWKEESNGQN